MASTPSKSFAWNPYQDYQNDKRGRAFAPLISTASLRSTSVTSLPSTDGTDVPSTAVDEDVGSPWPPSFGHDQPWPPSFVSLPAVSSRSLPQAQHRLHPRTAWVPDPFAATSNASPHMPLQSTSSSSARCFEPQALPRRTTGVGYAEAANSRVNPISREAAPRSLHPLHEEDETDVPFILPSALKRIEPPVTEFVLRESGTDTVGYAQMCLDLLLHSEARQYFWRCSSGIVPSTWTQDDESPLPKSQSSRCEQSDSRW